MSPRVRSFFESFYFHQIFGALATVAMTFVLGWAADFASLPSDMKQVKASTVRAEQAAEAARVQVAGEIDRAKAKDEELAHRMDLADDMHVRIIQEHRELRGLIPYGQQKAEDRGARRERAK